MIERVGTFCRYAGEYQMDGRQFIIVCGNINYGAVQTFLHDFFHPARDDVDVEVLFLNKKDPDLEFEGLLKREHTRVQYFKGDALLLTTTTAHSTVYYFLTDRALVELYQTL